MSEAIRATTKKKALSTPEKLRPMPPPDLNKAYDGNPLIFMPAYDMPQWVKDTFLEPASKLFNQSQYHLYDFMDGVQITFLWAAGGYESKGRYVAGQCEEIRFMCNKWQKWRQEQQMMQWFGLHLPSFVITLDGNYCNQCSDLEFCALLEHELYHIGHEYNGDMPLFSMDTGLPKLKIRGHDVEEFGGVVRRWGVGHPEGKLAQMVRDANKGPEIARLDVAHACGTCLKLVA